MFEKLPPLFLERVKKILNETEFEAYRESFEKTFMPSLRINSLKINEENFFRFFSKPEKKVSWAENSFFIDRKSVFTKTPFYHAGLFYIQEASSMLPAEILNPKPGEIVLDACASPGSKTTQMIAKMKNQGVLIANEFQHDRVGRLIENVSRWGAKNTVITHQPTSSFSSMVHFFDKILIDAPCSGEGMFRKDEEAVRCWSLSNVKTCSSTQKKILRDLIPALKPGGTLVYSTCTLAPEENEENVDWILKTYPGLFELEEIHFGKPGITEFEKNQYSQEVKKTRRILPQVEDSEAFFVAKLVKKDEKKEISPSLSRKNAFIRQPNKNLVRSFQEEIKIKNLENLFQIGYRVYSWGNLDENTVLPVLPLIRPVYLGILAGCEKKNRIEPEYPLALSFLKEELENSVSIELDEENTVQYLRGAELKTDNLTKIPSKEGFQIITYQGYPIGWGKLKEKKIKNLFPHNLRNKI